MKLFLQEGAANFIQMGRALMEDPELSNKTKESRLIHYLSAGLKRTGGQGFSKPENYPARFLFVAIGD